MKKLIVIMGLLLMVLAGAAAQEAEYEALGRQAGAHIAAGEYGEAIPLLERMYELRPGELAPIEYLGLLYTEMPEDRPSFANTLFWLLEAERRYSENQQVYYILACLYSLKGDLENAIRAMDKAVLIGFWDFKLMSAVDVLANFRTTGWWKEIEGYYLDVAEQMSLFTAFIGTEEDRTVEERIGFYSSVIATLERLAPHISGLSYFPLRYLAKSLELGKNQGIAVTTNMKVWSIETCYLKQKDIIEKTLGRDHPGYARSVNDLGSLYRDMGDYAKAEPYLLEAKATVEKALGRGHPAYAQSINNLGVLYQDMGDHTKAESYYLEAKAIREKALGRNHSDYIASVNNLGSLYYAMGDYAKAEPYLLERKAIVEKALGRDHPDYAQLVNNLGLLYHAMGDYAKAETYYLEAKTIREKDPGRDHSDYATSVNNLGTLYSDMGAYAKAETYYLEAKTIQEKALGREHPDYATSVNNLGSLHYAMGNYDKAEIYLLEAKAIREKAPGRDHPDYAVLVNNLGMLYYTMGNYAKAEPYLLEAKAIREKILGREHPDYAVSVNNLGSLYQAMAKDMGDYAKAELYYLEAKGIREKALGREHPDYAASVNNLGMLYYTMGAYAKAETYLLETKTIFEKVLGRDHPDYATSINNLGLLYWAMGNYTKAEPYYLEAKGIREKAPGRNHPDYTTSVNNLGSLYQNMGDYTQATMYREEGSELTIDRVNRSFSFLSEQQRSSYWNTQSGLFEAAYSLSYFHPIAAVNNLNYNNTLFSKGLLLRTTNAVRDSIYSSGDPILIGKFEELGRLRGEISRLQQSGGNREYIEALETRAEALDKSLTQASAASQELKADMAMQWKDVRDHLRADEAAIEFVSFQLYDKTWTDQAYYAALLLRPGMETPTWVPLCEETQLEALLEKTKDKSSAEQTQILYDDFGAELYAAIWQPLEKELAGVRTVFYAASGLLHKIAFAALPVTADKRTRLRDQYDLNLVSSTREVATRDRAGTFVLSSAVIYGGLQYTETAELMQAAAQNYKTNERLASAGGLAIANATRGGGGEVWPDLFYTQSEARKVQGLLQDAKVPKVTAYGQRNGNEESFKSLDGSKIGLIHLATHGFFLDDPEKKQEQRELVERIGGRGTKAVENPLLHSGLILAGGNNAWTGYPVEGVEDGILTADEIARMNLTGTSLVVLSACQTGLGQQVNNSEGVFGLQRAFKLAGVETLIMSLWKVDDAVTSELMETFYKQWLGGKSKQEAFKDAQRLVRNKHPQPYFWAAFVMMD